MAASSEGCTSHRVAAGVKVEGEYDESATVIRAFVSGDREHTLRPI